MPGMAFWRFDGSRLESIIPSEYMVQADELIWLNIDCEPAVRLVTDCLQQAGLQVVPCFDLRAARASMVHCNCPHHGLQRCDCQFVVLLVYGKMEHPLTLMVHGNGGRTLISYVVQAESGEDVLLQTTVLESLNAKNLISRLNKDIIYQNTL